MRARKRSDIRTTGIVQLESTRSKKRPRGKAFDSTEVAAGRIEAKDSLEQQGAKDERPETSHAGTREAETSSPPETTKEPVAAEKKTLRQFTRTRNSRDRKCAERSRTSDATSDMVASGRKDGVEDEQGRIRRSSRKKVVDMQQLTQYINFLEDEDLLEEPKVKVPRRSKQETAAAASKSRDKLDVIEACLSFLEELGLFKDVPFSEDEGATAVHPGTVGDGDDPQNCKICGRPEDGSSLVCDVCDETFHVSCCYPKLRSVPRDDRWLCSFCTRKRKKKSAELKIFPAGHFDEKLPPAWIIDKTKVRGWDLARMERSQVRVGSKFQADVPDWSGGIMMDDLRSDYPGLESALTAAELQKEKELAERNVANNVWPKGWLPADKMPHGSTENWLQCQNIMHEEGDRLPNGEIATQDNVCGKWRRAPLHIDADDGWECSCAITWDPRHADCAVSQELPTEEIRKRPRVKMQSPEEWRNSGRKRAAQSMADF